MNKAEKMAKQMYEFNKFMVEQNSPYLSPLRLFNIAMQQDKLYKVIHARSDRKLSGGRAMTTKNTEELVG